LVSACFPQVLKEINACSDLVSQIYYLEEYHRNFAAKSLPLCLENLFFKKVVLDYHNSYFRIWENLRFITLSSIFNLSKYKFVYQLISSFYL
jgi:hypothetical protein